MVLPAAVLALLVAQAAPAAPAAPIADRLLLSGYAWDIVGGRVTVSRAGPDGPRLLEDSLTAAGLDDLLRESTRAADLAREAHHELQWGYALKYSGLLGALAGAVCVTVGAAQYTDGNAQVVLETAGGTLFFTGVIAAVFGIAGINNGIAKALDAVSAYNLDVAVGGSAAPARGLAPP